MLAQLTPEQGYELMLYHAMEPFGELRDDMRLAQMLEFYYTAKGGQKKRTMRLTDFILYADIREEMHKRNVSADLRAALSLAEVSNG